MSEQQTVEAQFAGYLPGNTQVYLRSAIEKLMRDYELRIADLTNKYVNACTDAATSAARVIELQRELDVIKRASINDHSADVGKMVTAKSE